MDGDRNRLRGYAGIKGYGYHLAVSMAVEAFFGELGCLR